MTKEELRQKIKTTMEELNIGDEDFIGYSYSDNVVVWFRNMNVLLLDTYKVFVRKRNKKKIQLVKDKHTQLLDDFVVFAKEHPEEQEINNIINIMIENNNG